MYEYKILDAAISIATESHFGQYDREGKPYILHAMYVMNKLIDDPVLAAIGVMHDVIEDSVTTMSDINHLFDYNTRIKEAMTLLTKTKGMDYLNDYILGVCLNIDAMRVKLVDLEHNLQIARLGSVNDKDWERIKKYKEAERMINQSMGSMSELGLL